METEQTVFGRFSAYLQISPLVVILLLFLIAPMFVILLYSLFKFGPFATQVGVFVLDNYARTLSFDSATWGALGDTIKTTAITWSITLVLGFVLTYYLVFDVLQLRIKIFLFLLAVVPFWTSGVVRMIAWLPFLGKEGLINGSLMGLGLTDEPLQFLLFSDFAVILSYVHVLTLFMVAPLFNVMARIDLRLIEAARGPRCQGLADSALRHYPVVASGDCHRHDLHRCPDGVGLRGRSYSLRRYVGHARHGGVQPVRPVALPIFGGGGDNPTGRFAAFCRGHHAPGRHP